MIDIKELTKCCGCKSCVDICPKNAIRMIPDKETFLYPDIDNQKCINCGLCDLVCPANYTDFTSCSATISYIGINNDEKELINSSSGGAFIALCKIFISKGYSVFGVKYLDDLKVAHEKANTVNDCLAFQKSKYILSDTNGCFVKISELLKNGEKVLFSGSPCQCAALQMFLNVKRISFDNLFIINVLCHGCPSQNLFNRYIEENNIEKYIFRYKENPGANNYDSRRSFRVFRDGSSSIGTTDNDAFLRGYYKRLFYRPSCYKCRFAIKDRCSDVTIGDAWGLEHNIIDRNNKEGVSLLLFNTDKGKEIIDELQHEMTLYSIDNTTAFNSQSVFSKPISAHPKRELFFSYLRKTSFNNAVKYATKPTIKGVLNTLFKNGFIKTIKKSFNRIKS